MKAREQRGYSLTELIIVISILGVVAAIAIPGLSSDDTGKLELASAEVADAVRFAHSEAMRTGEPHGIHAQQSNQRIRAYRLDTSVNPFVINYDLYDPLTKQLYDLNFGTGTTDVTVSSVYFKFKGSFFPTSYLGFSGGTGLPKFNDSGTVRMLETAFIRLGHDGHTMTISISPMTGRVTVQ